MGILTLRGRVEDFEAYNIKGCLHPEVRSEDICTPIFFKAPFINLCQQSAA